MQKIFILANIAYAMVLFQHKFIKILFCNVFNALRRASVAALFNKLAKYLG